MTTNEYRPRWGNQRGGRGTNGNNGHTQHTTRGAAGQLIYSEAGKPIASLRDGVLHKTVSSARGHMYQNPRGWGLDVCALEQVKASGGHTIQLTDQVSQTTRIVYRTSVTIFDQFGLRRNYGYGAQVILPLAYWNIDGEPPTAKAAREPEPDQPPEPESVQLCLFP